MSEARISPGLVRDAIIEFLRNQDAPATVARICAGVRKALERPVPDSSVRSYLNLNAPGTFRRTQHGRYQLDGPLAFLPPSSRDVNGSNGSGYLCDDGPTPVPPGGKPVRLKIACEFGRATLFQNDCLDWLRQRDERSVHAVVTDPPYGLVEYSDVEQFKMRGGRGGVWRIPPSFDGCKRRPLPRFTTLSASQVNDLAAYFRDWARALRRALVPGAHVFVASNPLVSYAVAKALVDAGLERRGEIIRLVMTLRGGDRPKNAHEEFPDVTVMPRSMWEPWLLFREPLDGRVQDNLRRWKTGALRRPSVHHPFGDVIESSPTHKSERKLAPHPSLKPQAFLRKIVRAALPLGKGIVLDPFAGAGSTLAACEHVGYPSIGVEIDDHYVQMAKTAIPRLTAHQPGSRR